MSKKYSYNGSMPMRAYDVCHMFKPENCRLDAWEWPIYSADQLDLPEYDLYSVNCGVEVCLYVNKGTKLTALKMRGYRLSKHNVQSLYEYEHYASTGPEYTFQPIYEIDTDFVINAIGRSLNYILRRLHDIVKENVADVITSATKCGDEDATEYDLEVLATAFELTSQTVGLTKIGSVALCANREIFIEALRHNRLVVKEGWDSETGNYDGKPDVYLERRRPFGNGIEFAFSNKLDDCPELYADTEYALDDLINGRLKAYGI